MNLLDRLMSQGDTDLFLTTTASPKSERALKMFDWSRVPVKAFDRSAFWITSYAGFAKSFLNLKAVPVPGLLCYPVSAALFCRDIFGRNETGRNRSDSKLELCTGFDNRFDDFWEELTQQNDNVLLPYRTRETLEWHFRSPLMRQELTILSKSKGSRMVAYAIFDRQDNPACGLKRIRLIDFQALKGFESTLSSAVCWMSRKCRKDSIDMIENVGAWIDLLKASKLPKPYYRPLPAALYYYNVPSKELSDVLNSSAVWAPTTFDGDASL